MPTTDERLAEAITLLEAATAGDWNLYFDDAGWDDDSRDDWMLAKSRNGLLTKGVVAEIRGCKEGDAILLSRAKSLVVLAMDLAGERDAARLATTDRVGGADRAGTDNGSGIEMVGGGEAWQETLTDCIAEEAYRRMAELARRRELAPPVHVGWIDPLEE